MIHFLSLLALVATTFSKAEFFKTLEAGEQANIVALEKKIAAATASVDQQAYYGTIMMKSAEYQKTAGDKLKKFKEGKTLLEAAIQSNSANVEYRFLRLMIQENAPKILKYTANIKEDAAFIKANQSKASKEVKTAIVNYAGVSANLKL